MARKITKKAAAQTAKTDAQDNTSTEAASAETAAEDSTSSDAQDSGDVPEGEDAQGNANDSGDVPEGEDAQDDAQDEKSGGGGQKLDQVTTEAEEVACPKCGATEKSIYKTRGIPRLRRVVRYCKCAKCGHHFRHVERRRFKSAGVPKI